MAEGKGRVRRVAGVTLSLAGLVFVTRAIVAEWPIARTALGDADARWLSAAWLLGAAGVTVAAWMWRSAAASLGAQMSGADSVSLFFRGEIAKYVPGGPWAVVGRGELARRAGFERSVSYGSVLLSLVAQYLAAALVAVAYLPFASPGPGTGMWLLAAVPAGLVSLHPRVVSLSLSLLERLVRRPFGVVSPPWGRSLGLVLRYVPVWVLIATATWSVARAFVPTAGYPDVALAALVSWLIGFLVFPAPGGLGVREATFVAVVVTLPSGVDATVAVIARLLFMSVDAVGAVTGWAMSRDRSTRGLGR